MISKELLSEVLKLDIEIVSVALDNDRLRINEEEIKKCSDCGSNMKFIKNMKDTSMSDEPNCGEFKCKCGEYSRVDNKWRTKHLVGSEMFHLLGKRYTYIKCYTIDIYKLNKKLIDFIKSNGFDISCGYTITRDWCQLYRARPVVEQKPCTPYFHGEYMFIEACQWILENRS